MTLSPLSGSWMDAPHWGHFGSARYCGLHLPGVLDAMEYERWDPYSLNDKRPCSVRFIPERTVNQRTSMGNQKQCTEDDVNDPLEHVRGSVGLASPKIPLLRLKHLHGILTASTSRLS